MQKTSTRNESAGNVECPVDIAAGRGVFIEGSLCVPENASGVVVFAHGSGSSRHSPRNQYVAGALREGNLGTLLLDLLTAQEEANDARTGRLRFDIRLLSDRLLAGTDWLAKNPDTSDLEVGCFGASTGAAAALLAAAERPESVKAIVSRGGRPDLAGAVLQLVKAPTLLIVGGADYDVLAINRQALERLKCEKELVTVPEATHVFEEPGALEQVAQLAKAWFTKYL